jgi:enoyl-CoA hydratase
MEYFDVEQRGPIQIWKIKNPPMNYMTGPLSRELVQLIGKLEGDDNTRVLIITGGVEGKFITHYSVDELAASAADPAECARVMPRFFAASHRTLNRVMLLPQAVIAAINGDCMGGGYELALACDFRLAADGPYQIGLIEILLGLLPGGGGTQRLTRLIGRGPALEALLFGTAYSPAEAHRIGMVNRVVAPDKLMSTAMEWAETLASRPPRSIAAIKRAVYLGGDRDLETGLYVERNEMANVVISEDSRNLMRAYNEAVAKDPMEARNNFLRGIGIPPAKGR